MLNTVEDTVRLSFYIMKINASVSGAFCCFTAVIWDNPCKWQRWTNKCGINSIATCYMSWEKRHMSPLSMTLFSPLTLLDVSLSRRWMSVIQLSQLRNALTSYTTVTPHLIELAAVIFLTQSVRVSPRCLCVWVGERGWPAESPHCRHCAWDGLWDDLAWNLEAPALERHQSWHLGEGKGGMRTIREWPEWLERDRAERWSWQTPLCPKSL